MQRRKFKKDTGTVAFGIGLFGNIAWTGQGFIGDTPTTTDSLGPFYRSGAPLKQNLNPNGFTGDVLPLTGAIIKEDGKTPAAGSLVEVGQCGPDGLYDNDSVDYVYRSSQKLANDGKYHFLPTRTVPCRVKEGSAYFRPAHIHLRISAIGEQDLITQVFFTGDPQLADDPCTRSPLAIHRILPAREITGKESEIGFDIVLKKEYLPDESVFRKLAGV